MIEAYLDLKVGELMTIHPEGLSAKLIGINRPHQKTMIRINGGSLYSASFGTYVTLGVGIGFWIFKRSTGNRLHLRLELPNKDYRYHKIRRKTRVEMY